MRGFAGRDGDTLEVCIVGPGLKFLSGLSVYTNRLATALSEQYTVSVLLLRDLIPARFYPGGSRVGRPLTSLSYDGLRSHDGLDWWWGGSLLHSLRFLRAQRPDVLVLQWWTAATAHSYLLLILLAKVHRIPVVIEFHEVQDTGEVSIPGVASYGRVALRVLVALSSGAVVHHEHDLAALSAVADLAQRPVQIASHANYDHLLAVAPLVPDELVDVAVAPGERVAMFFGLIRPYKGLEDFVAAIDMLSAQEVSGLRFVICGETWEGSTQGITAARQSRWADRITLVNRYVSDREAAALFGRADALVLPYRRASSSGPMAIAMAFGLRVVYYDIAGLSSVARHYDGARPVRPGIVADLAEQLRALAAEPVGPSRQPSPDSASWSRTTEAYQRLFAAMGLTRPALPTDEHRRTAS